MMTTPSRRSALLPLLATLIAAATVTTAAGAHAASFTVQDDKAEEEIGETTRLYIDGRLVAVFKLGEGMAHKQIQVSAPDTGGGTLHQYVLCGAIAYRAADGSRKLRQVSGQGSLPAPDGHTFLAVGSNDFTRFFLIDPSDRAAATADPNPSPFCQAPIS